MFNWFLNILRLENCNSVVRYENFILVTECISSYVFTFVTKLNWMNKTLLKLRVAQWDGASPPNCKVPDSNSTDAVSVGFRIQPRYKTPGDPRVSWP